MIDWYLKHSALERLERGWGGGVFFWSGVVGELALHYLFDLPVRPDTGSWVIDYGVWFAGFLILGLLLGELVARLFFAARRPPDLGR